MMLTALITFLLIMMFTLSVSATGETGREKNHKIASGVWESTVYVTDSKGDNVRVHILRISEGANTTLKATTANYYKKGSTKASRKKSVGSWGFSTVKKMMAGYDASKGVEGRTIAGINGDFYIKEKNGKTRGKLIAEGNVINSSKEEPFFAVMKDGSYQILDGKKSTKNVKESVAGLTWLVRKGVVTGAASGDGDTIMSIGVTELGDAVIACIDGREPTSVGTTMYDAGEIMLKQGCINAILLDCGGSAQFVTKRNSGKAVQRNVPNDGVARPVSSGLLVVRKSKKTASNDMGPAVSMKEDETALNVENGCYSYIANGEKISGFKIINNNQYLFDNRGEGLTKTIEIGKTRYYFKNGRLSRTSDKKAGKVAIGYCGASSNKTNLLYAYNYGDKKLSIGLNPLVKKNSGKMENWSDVRYVPWLAVIRFVKSVDVGKGVKNIGDHFMFIAKSPFNEEAKKIRSPLRRVTLPDSLTTIGEYAFFNNQRLTNISIPKKVTSIKAVAFGENGKVTYIFKGKTPPSFGRKVFYASYNSVIKAPASAKWKQALSSSTKKYISFRGTARFTS